MLPTLATKDDLEALATKAAVESIETELHKLIELVTDALAEARKARDEIRYISGVRGGMPHAGHTLVDYVQTLVARLERLEKRGEG